MKHLTPRETVAVSFKSPVLRPQTASRGPLSGFLVVGLEHSVAGPLCTRILGDLGADVIKVESAPHGDFARRWDGNVAGECSQFWWLNRRKRSVVLDLRAERGWKAFEVLLKHADAFVCNLAPSATERLGISEKWLARQYPELVVCQISGYGRGGPYRDRKAYDMLVQAEAGIMSLTGSPQQPSRTGVSIADVGTGIYAATLVLAALLGRMRGEGGRYLDVAMFDATLEFAAPMLISFVNAGVIYRRFPDRHHAIAPYGVFRCSDGTSVVIAIAHDSEWRTFAERILRCPELATDGRFSTTLARMKHRTEVDEIAGRAIASLPGREVVRLLADLGLSYALLNDMESVSAHPVLAEREILGDVRTSAESTVRSLVGLGERLFSTSRGEHAPPPELGQDTEAVLAALGFPADGSIPSNGGI